MAVRRAPFLAEENAALKQQLKEAQQELDRRAKRIRFLETGKKPEQEDPLGVLGVVADSQLVPWPQDPRPALLGLRYIYHKKTRLNFFQEGGGLVRRMETELERLNKRFGEPEWLQTIRRIRCTCRAASQLGGQPMTDWINDCKFRLVAAHLHQSMDASRDRLVVYGEFPQDNHVDLKPHTEIGRAGSCWS
jgi:hypothetical protein